MTRRVALVALATALFVGTSVRDGDSQSPTIPTTTLRTEVDAFFDREVAAHFTEIPESGPLPDRVHGALTTGDFSWGTFVRALAAYGETRRTREVSGRNIVPLVARVGVSESANGGKAFAQLYAALALRHFGADLSTNALWQSMSEGDRAAWRQLLDPRRFYDPATRRVIDLPENYLGVAARVATLAFQMGVLPDRAFVDALIDRAAEPFTKGALFADDAGAQGRYDRYSNEYARYVYEAAETVGRRDILTALAPSITAQMRLWWDLASPDGYGYPWGRSLGVVSYLDTLEIVAFVAAHPEFRPAALPDLTSEYHLAWRWLRRNYSDDRHLIDVFAPGRGNYAYITKEREWQQTVGFFGKAIMAHDTLMRVLAAERVDVFPAQPTLPAVARFQYFRQGDRPAGVWVVRQGDLRFALPITTGTIPGVSDYLPAPHGMIGFVAPVERPVPAGASFYELPDGRVLAATDGADEIVPAPDGRSLRVTYRRLTTVGGRPGAWVEPGFEVNVTWRIEAGSLVRRETITATSDVTLTRLEFRLTSTATSHATPPRAAVELRSPEGVLRAYASGPLRMATSIRTYGDEPLGRGPRLPATTHVIYEAQDVRLGPGRSVAWELVLTPSSDPR